MIGRFALASGALMCVFCAEANNDKEGFRPEKALGLLALLERSETLSRVDALRVAARLLAWTEMRNSNFRCDEVRSASAPRTES